MAVLESWGLIAEVGVHALGQWGYLAGRDEDRLSDLNDAFRSPEVRAVIATTGGAGAYRSADEIDFNAVRADPRPLVGFSDITSPHLALWRHCGLAGIHGFLAGSRSAASTRRLLMNGAPITLRRDPLFLEVERSIGLGQIDRQVTQLIRSGSLRGVRGVALGRFPGFDDYTDRGWTLVDVLTDRLGSLGVPVLGGLDVGRGTDPLSVPLGPPAVLNTVAGTLTVAPGVSGKDG
ncbi:S66 peptidase family protein [Amycolatopsis sp. cmx-11-51]|uniref:S66 peptidase family protein n=1 Tax=unclassified Amycolatopsis TaxID=2618356 RepID=UPI0039E44291